MSVDICAVCARLSERRHTDVEGADAAHARHLFTRAHRGRRRSLCGAAFLASSGM